MPPPPDPGHSRRSADDAASPTHGYGPKTASEPLLLSDRIVEELDLLSRNFDILLRVERQGPVGIIRLSSMMQLPLHKIRYSLHLLEREGLLQPTPEGAIVTERASGYLDYLLWALERVEEAVGHLRERARERRGQAARANP